MLPIAPGQKVHTETFKYKSAIEIAEGGQPVTAELRMVHETLGDPPVASVLVVDSDGLLLTEDGRANIVLQPTGGRLRSFLRGDANNDSIVNIADGVWILSWSTGAVANPVQGCGRCQR